MSMIDPKGSNPAMLRNSECEKRLAKVNVGAVRRTAKTKNNGTDFKKDTGVEDLDE
jgi:hypothetical protein